MPPDAMTTPDSRIVQFISKHHVFTLATCVDEEAWCAHCFYAYLPETVSLVFTSDVTTKHIEQVCHNCYVAGSIVVESHMIGSLRGLQFQGVVTPAEGAALETARKAYLGRFPVARLMETTLWQLDITTLKYTDNRLGFGKKLQWHRDGTLRDLLASLEGK